MLNAPINLKKIINQDTEQIGIRKRIFFLDCLGALITDVLIFLVLIIMGKGALPVYVFFGTPIIIYTIVIWLYYRDKFLISVAVFTLTATALVITASFWLNDLYFEGLMMIPIGLSSFLYTENHRFAHKFFMILIALGGIMIGIELVGGMDFREISDTYLLYEKVLIGMFFLVTFTKLVSLVFLYQKIMGESTSKDLSLHQSENRYQDIFENVYDGIVELNEDRQIIASNKKARQMLGIDEHTRIDIIDLIHPEDIDIARDYLKILKAEGKYAGLRGRMVNLRGETKHLEINSVGIFDNQGNLTGSRDILRDITDQVAVNEKIRENQALIESVINSSEGTDIFAFNTDFELIMFNSSARNGFKRAFNIDLEIGKRLKSELPEEIGNYYRNLMKEAMKGKIQKIEPSFSFGNRVHYFSTIVSPITDRQGNVYGSAFISTDVTHLKLAEKALQASETRYRSIFENNIFGIVHLDRETNFMASNEAFMDMMGFNQEELKQQSVISLTHPDYLNESIRLFTELVSGEKSSFIQEKKYIRKAGTEFYAVAAVKGIFDSHGNFVSAIATVQDVSESKNVLLALAESEKKFRNVFNNSYQGIAIFDLKEKYLTDCNDRMYEIFGCESRLEFLSQKREAFVMPVQKGGVPSGRFFEDLLENCMINGYAEAELLCRKIDGTPITCEVTVVPNFHEARRDLIYFISDITERERSRSEIAKSLSLISATLESTNDGILVVGNSGKVTVYNQHFLSLWRIPQEKMKDVTSRELLEYVKPQLADYTAFIEKVNHLYGNPEAVSFDMIYFRDGRIFERYSQPQKIGQQILGRAFSFRDVTDRIEQEAIIQQQLEDLNEKNIELQKYITSNLELENFAYVASHDLRAPIRSIISFTQLLQVRLGESLGEEDKEYMDIIVSASRNMHDLINDLLEYSRVNTNKIHLERTDITQVIKGILMDIKSNIVEKNAIIEVEENLPELYADKLRIRQLFQNLLVNALKFTADDTRPVITIGCARQKKKWVFFVKDNGIGIEKEFLDKIFLLFRRLNDVRKFEGTGIGLAICKKIVEQHDGKIWVESEPGKGSTFYFSLSTILRKNSEIIQKTEKSSYL